MNLVFSHSGCLDGQCAEYLIRKSVDKSISCWIYAGKLTVDEIKKRITPDTSKIFIADLSVSQEVFEYLASLSIAFEVFDHHEPRIQDSRIHNQVDKCASLIVWDHLNPGVSCPSLLAYIDDRDRGINRLDKTEEILCAIHTQVRAYGFDKVFQSFDVETFAQQGAILLADRKIRLDEIIKQGYERTLKIGDQSFSVLLVTGDRTLRSDIHGKDSKYDISVFYTLDAKTKSLWLAWRSNKVDLVKFLSQVSWLENGRVYFGGGHPSAAGCTINDSSKIGEKPINLLNWVETFFC